MASRSRVVSAGLLLFRRTPALEIFLAHPGGPFWQNKDIGAWTIPKGVSNPEEELLDAALREFEEETGIRPQRPFCELGSIRQKSGKTVYAWAWEGNADAERIVSNLTLVRWPPRTGDWIEIPEVDRCEWFAADLAKRKINPAQAELIVRLEAMLITM